MFGNQPQPFTPMQSAAVNGARDLTAYDLNMGPVASRGLGGLNIQFFYARVRLDNPSDVTLNGTYQNRLCVAKQPKGDRLTIAQEFLTEEQAMERYPNEFSAFKRYEAVPTNGTPLFELPGISESQIAQLVIHGLRCIEDVAACAQEQINTMGMDAVRAHRIAKRWLEAKDEAAPIFDQAKADVENQQLRDQLAKAMAQIGTLSAQVEVVTRMQPMMAAQQAGQMPGMVPMSGPGMSAARFLDELADEGVTITPLPEGGLVLDNSDLDGGPVVELPGLDEKPTRGRR